MVKSKSTLVISLRGLVTQTAVVLLQRQAEDLGPCRAVAVVYLLYIVCRVYFSNYLQITPTKTAPPSGAHQLEQNLGSSRQLRSWKACRLMLPVARRIENVVFQR